MTQTIYQVDAFTSMPFRGNPAGVCILPSPADPAWMQSVAAEMNLAETAFLVPQADGFNLRWFTPAVEVKLCGHATLASAHILWQTGTLPSDQQARFHTLSGLLTADQGADGWITLNFPVTLEHPVEPPADLLPALGVTASYVGKNEFDYLVEVDSEAAVRATQPEFTRLGKIPARGIIVTARSTTPGADFVSRFFAPAAGINEDPVTGSAHCCLAPYWAAKLGKDTLIGRQISARGGIVKTQLANDRVLLSGQAITTLRCDLLA
jgi:PhzF family phenazine biosynthesis protein